ncbi:MAG: hypothetical protein MJ208_00715 [Bacilli bacterium]|nr:hypothetical protein [Bacilli bacterium]
MKNTKFPFLSHSDVVSYRDYLCKLNRKGVKNELFNIFFFESVISYKYLVYKSWITLNVLENINEKNALLKLEEASKYIKNWINLLDHYMNLTNLKDTSFVEPFYVDVLTIDSMCNDAALSKMDMVDECVRTYEHLGIHHNKEKIRSNCLFESFKLCLIHSYNYTANVIYNVYNKKVDKDVELLQYPELILGRKKNGKWIINSVINRYKSQIHFFFESYLN